MDETGPEHPSSSEPSWVHLSDPELLQLRICDLGVRIEGTELEPNISELGAELSAKNISFRPKFYLGDEWFSPEGTAAIAIPFYLAHPRLRALEMRQMLEVEGGTPEWCLQLLRHETGHALDHAFQFSLEPEWQELFGSPDTEYTPETYRPRPYSKSFVRHLENWYAQSHPDEDFAETFATWLGSPAEEWRSKYEGWKALEKIEYVDRIMTDLPNRKPHKGRPRLISQAAKLRKTLGRYYAERRAMFAEDFPDFYDADLRMIFSPSDPEGEPAAKFMQRNRPRLNSSIVRWTGQRKYTVDMLVRRLTERCRDLELRVPKDPVKLSIDIGAYLSALVTNHLHTGKFKRSV